MITNKYLLLACLNILFISTNLRAQTSLLSEEAEDVMLRATKFMANEVSTNGGYVWYYAADLSRRWGEMEAFDTMIWVQGGGTVSAGHTLLEAFQATGNEYFYNAAEKTATALMVGQSQEGGWNYMIDFAGEESLKKWYNTIGKNGWRLEEFQHYYGNDTYDDHVTSDAARFLLKMYLQKKDPKYKAALDKAINFILKSQYPIGGWPQRYPLKYDFKKFDHPDYSSYFTFNDNVIWENINFLIQCYQLLGDTRFLDPIYRGMNFYLRSQQSNGAWGQQYTMSMEPAGARTYEPSAYLPSTTLQNCYLLMRFYQYTGDPKFLKGIPKAIEWLEKVKLPAHMTAGGRYSHPLYVEPGTEKPIFVHRKGANVTYGAYYTDYNDNNLLAHMVGKRNIDIQRLKEEYARISAIPSEQAIKNSPLKSGNLQRVASNFFLNRDNAPDFRVNELQVKKIINSLDNRNRWLVKHVMISNPYKGDGQNKELTDEYATTFVGDETDTSPYRDVSEKEYISTPEYIKNMRILINFINSTKVKTDTRN